MHFLLPLHRFWISWRLLLRQLCLNLMGELVQVFVHALHAEPLRVEQTTVLAGERKMLCFQSSFFNPHFTPKGYFVFTIHVILPHILFVLAVARSATVHVINSSQNAELFILLLSQHRLAFCTGCTRSPKSGTFPCPG